MFLAPFTPGRVNVVRIDLGPRPQSFAVLRLWNYAKTTTRGVRNFEVMLDGMVLYQGTARPAPPRVGNALAASSDFVQSVLFTDNEAIIREEAHHVYTQEDLEDQLQVFDNGQKLAGGSSTRTEEIVRPTTSVVGAAPPTARRGERAVAGIGINNSGAQSYRSGVHANPHAALASAHMRQPAAAALRQPSAAALRRPAGSGAR